MLNILLVLPESKQVFPAISGAIATAVVNERLIWYWNVNGVQVPLLTVKVITPGLLKPLVFMVTELAVCDAIVQPVIPIFQEQVLAEV